MGRPRDFSLVSFGLLVIAATSGCGSPVALATNAATSAAFVCDPQPDPTSTTVPGRDICATTTAAGRPADADLPAARESNPPATVLQAIPTDQLIDPAPTAVLLIERHSNKLRIAVAPTTRQINAGPCGHHVAIDLSQSSGSWTITAHVGRTSDQPIDVVCTLEALRSGVVEISAPATVQDRTAVRDTTSGNTLTIETGDVLD